IEHARFGQLTEVDTGKFSDYTFRFQDGQWATIESEQELGRLNASSPGLLVNGHDPGNAGADGWDLTVTLADVRQSSIDDR
ncbi:MAG TPA: hypothetical protein VHG10_08610, partial [Glycomyces sp.]|nr:hypothetical protein [Glycomyces sp.]